MKVAFLTASGSSEAIRVVTAARWSGSLACLNPKSKLIRRTAPTPAGPDRKPSSQPSIADMRAPSYRRSYRVMIAQPQRGDIAARLRANPASLKPGAPLVHALTTITTRDSTEHYYDRRHQSRRVG